MTLAGNHDLVGKSKDSQPKGCGFKNLEFRFFINLDQNITDKNLFSDI